MYWGMLLLVPEIFIATCFGTFFIVAVTREDMTNGLFVQFMTSKLQTSELFVTFDFGKLSVWYLPHIIHAQNIFRYSNSISSIGKCDVCPLQTKGEPHQGTNNVLKV